MDKKQIGTIVIVVVITALITYFLIPTKTVVKSQTIMVADTGKIAKAEYTKALQQRDDALSQVSGLKKLLNLAQIQKPTGGGVSNPITSPVEEVKPVQKDTTHEKIPMLYPYDFPISAKITKSKITFLTTNRSEERRVGKECRL